MRHAILLDNKITTAKYNAWVKEDTAFWKEHIGITPEYVLIRTDYTTYPTYFDNDGDVRPTKEYLQSLNDQAVAKLGEFGFDFAMVMIHEDNWRSAGPLKEEIQKKAGIVKEKGIWGVNFSYVYGKQCLDYCRWDKDDTATGRANTFGTAYHERHHSFDVILKQEIGININPILDVERYDRDVTHGGLKEDPTWDYIRHKENTMSLKIMKPYLQQAFKKRKERHDEVIDKMKMVISLLQKLVYLLTMKFNKKDGYKA